MATRDLGPWAPLTLQDTIATFSGARIRWWISGGGALELHVGRSWRDHHDADVGMLRQDLPHLPSEFQRWDICVAAAGRLDPYRGQALRRELHQNNLWCRRSPADPWSLDLTINEGDREGWICRRDPTIRVPWDEAVLTTHDGVPYLAPDLQLLFKSRAARPKDDLDARHVIPELHPAQRSRLARLLPTDHPWQATLTI